MLLGSLPPSAAAQERPLQFAFGKPLSIPPQGAGRVYQPQSGKFGAGPPAIHISGAAGSITRLTVHVQELSHESPEDLDILLVGPDGQAVMLMSDAGGDAPVFFADLVFDDASAHPVPTTTLESGRFRPTDHEPGDSLSSPAPLAPYGSSLSLYTGREPNGEWRLYVHDDTLRPEEADGFAAAASLQAWSLEIVTTESDAARPPDNDQFAQRLPIEGLAGVIQVPSTGVCPTTEPREPVLPGAPTDDAQSLWFSWISPASGRLSLRTEESSYLPRIALYTGSAMADLAPLSGIGDYPVQAGTTYQIRIDGSQEPLFGNLVLSWELKGSQLGPVHSASVRSPGSGYQVLVHVAGSDSLRVTPYEAGDSQVTFAASGLWTGLYLYDYAAGRFTSAMYDRELNLSPAAQFEEPSGDERNSRSTAKETKSNSGMAAGNLSALRTSGFDAAPRFHDQQSVSTEVFAPASGWQVLIYNFSTGEISATSYSDSDGAVPFRLPRAQWIGLFHYDYVAGRFTESDLRLELEI